MASQSSLLSMTLGLVWFAGTEEQQRGRVDPEAASQSPIFSNEAKSSRGSSGPLRHIEGHRAQNWKLRQHKVCSQRYKTKRELWNIQASGEKGQLRREQPEPGEWHQDQL